MTSKLIVATLAMCSLVLLMADPAEAKSRQRRTVDTNPRPTANASFILGLPATRADDRPTRDVRFFRQVAYNGGR